MGNLRPLFEPVEKLLEKGGARKDVAFIVISTLSLLVSLFFPEEFPIDPAWIAVVLCGVPIVVGAFIALVCEFDVKADALVSIALIASLVVDQYFAAGEVAVIMQLGALLEELTVARAKQGISELIESAPRMARVVALNGEEREVDVDDVQVGEMVRVLPGETVPVDGVVRQGVTSIDESLVTGEPMPRDKRPGDEVSSGTVNQFGSIDVVALRVGRDGSIQRMMRLVQSADAGKAEIVRLADRWATWIVLGALVSAIVVYLVTGEILRAVTVLVVFCPCSLVLATPTAIVAAIGNATKHGFLVKEGDALERLADVKRIAFDKTGTLTEGNPQVSGVWPRKGSGFDSDSLYGLVASAELRSEHPLGKSIVRCARERAIAFSDPVSFEMKPGRGVAALAEGKHIFVGNELMLDELGVPICLDEVPGLERRLCAGDTVAYIAVDGVFAGAITLADMVRPGSRQMVQRIDQAGVRSVLLTGDTEAAARTVANEAGVVEYVARCRPEDKMSYIQQSESESIPCAMVGDGINDAPALMRAQVGIAVGGVGSDIAVEAADIVVVDSGVLELPHLIGLSRHMMRVIRANLTFSMTLNFVAIVLAFVAVLDPVSGALVHNCGSVFVILNSAFLLRWTAKKRG